MMLLGLWMLMLLRRCGCQAADAPEDATADFSVRLYHLLRIAGGEENIIFSPLSVTLTLGMLELGARGSSLEEIRQAVGREDEDVSVLSNLTLGQSEDEHVLRLLNSLVLQPDVELNPQLLQIMKKLFRVEMQMLNFSHPDDTVQYINSWVLNQTQNKISEMVSVDDFTGSTRMMLVNAVYFRGNWKNQFRPENTRTFSFTKDDGSEVQTLMMYQQGDFYYGEFSDGSTEAGGVYQVLEMLYEGEDMSMMIVLPRQEVPLASLEPIIRAPLLEEWASNVKRQKVEVYLPRFKVEQKLNLKELLKELSIRSIFTEDADLSAMTTDGQGLVLGAALQKSYLEVTEEGAEGVAGSGMMALTRTLVLYPQVMADHPFFFIIRNRKTGTILFIGRVMTPDLIQPFSDI